MNWLRLYHEVLDDPKVQRLDPVVFKAWVNLLCLASRSQPRGVLPGIEDIAFALRMGTDETNAAVELLVARGLIDRTKSGLAMHNWEARQFKSDNVSERVRRHRQATSGETLHETLRDKTAVTDEQRSTERNSNALDTEQNRTETEQSRGDMGASAPAKVTPIEKGKRGTKAPKHFDLDAEHYDAAEALGFTTQQTVDETARFLDWHRAKGTTHVDWTAAWRNWMRKARDLKAERGSKQTDADYWAEFDRLTGGGDVEVGP
jgi:hypothetical protein